MGFIQYKHLVCMHSINVVQLTFKKWMLYDAAYQLS